VESPSTGNAKNWPSFKDHFRRAHREFRESTDITLEDSELARNNANLVQQVVTGMQAAMAAESNPADDTTGMLLRASEAKMHEMQESMNLLQAQVANQRPAPYHPYNSYPTQSYPPPSNGGYQASRLPRTPATWTAATKSQLSGTVL
jgi:hypothetical protein